MEKTGQGSLEKALVELVENNTMLSYSRGIVQKTLGNYLSKDEIPSVAEDALSECLSRLLQLERDGKLSAEGLLDGNDGTGSLTDAVEKYLSTAISNYCKRRARFWSGSQNVGQEDGSSVKRVGYKARAITPADEYEAEAFWENLSLQVGRDTAEPQMDLLELLESVELSASERRYLLEKAEGHTYPGMAERHGGSPDKYRKIVSRAIAKIQNSPQVRNSL